MNKDNGELKGKEYKIERTYYFENTYVCLKYRLYKNGHNILNDEVGYVFRNLDINTKIIKEIISELREIGIEGNERGIGYETYLSIHAEKNKHSIKNIHSKVIKTIIKVIRRFEKMNKEIGLDEWLWEKWTYEFSGDE